MKNKAASLLCCLIIHLGSQAQDKKNPNPDPVHNWYGMSAYEFIFTKGEVTSNGQTLDNSLRFIPFFNIQSQRHINFSKHTGLYTGFGIRNVGFTNSIALPDGDAVTLKQRAYSAGIPLALKLGGMERGNYIALGAEAECMFNYKRKIVHGSNTTKTSGWFPGDVNLFNPSVFADIRFHNGTFFRFRYYLLDFLKNREDSFYLNDNGTFVSYHPEKSVLFYFAIGTAFKIKKKHHLTLNDV